MFNIGIKVENTAPTEAVDNTSNANPNYDASAFSRTNLTQNSTNGKEQNQTYKDSGGNKLAGKQAKFFADTNAVSKRQTCKK